MKKNNPLLSRVSAAVFIIIGVVFGATWKEIGFCLGDNVFSALGLPIWSDGTNGTHYPAMLGWIFILIGTGILNFTLQEKTRKWVWIIAILVLIVINSCLVYV